MGRARSAGVYEMLRLEVQPDAEGYEVSGARCNRRPTGSPRTGGATGLGPKDVRDLSGCCENVDVSETPFTNTLPIRRLGLTSGESAEIRVAYFDATELQSWPELAAISSPGK